MSIWAHDKTLTEASTILMDAAEASGYDFDFLLDIAMESDEIMEDPENSESYLASFRAVADMALEQDL